VEGAWSLKDAWEQFSTGFFLSFLALVILCYRAVRRKEATTLLFCVWSVGMLAATLGQNRFAYYYAVNVALLSAYLGAEILRWIWARLAAGDGRIPAPTPSRSPGRRRGGNLAAGQTWRLRTRGRGALIVKRACLIGGELGMLFLMFYPNIGLAIERAGQASTPHADWLSAMRWMREGTPDPFGDPDAYFALYETPPKGEPYPYPDSAYGVMSSWGYGYWITCMGHRIPNANPGQEGARSAAKFFTAQDEDSASAILDRLGTRYVIVDSSMPLFKTPGGQLKGKIGSLAHWAGKPRESFYEVCYRRDRHGELRAFAVYYPVYYRTLLSRLYVFRRKSIEPDEVYVMSFREQINDVGERYKEVTSASRFSTYEEAKAHLDQQGSESARIVGIDPYRSCVPLKSRLEDYRLMYRSPTVSGTLFGEPVSRVEIYEYLGWLRGREAEGLEQR
jgi:dolichyl-diphosphooligosaccharide--protein glycosyltransferase